MRGVSFRHYRNTVRQILGWTLLAGGLAGMVVPLLPSSLFILAGLGLLGDKSPWARRLLGVARNCLRLQAGRQAGEVKTTPPVLALSSSGQKAAGLSKDGVEHGTGQAPGQGVLLARVIRGQEDDAIREGEPGAVRKSGPRSWKSNPPFMTRPEKRVERDPS